MSTLTAAGPDTVQRGKTELWFRRVLLVFSVVAVLCLACQLGVALWAQNGFTGPECVVAAQSMMLAQDGTLYYDLNQYPYTVSAYTPLMYLLEAGLYRAGLPAYTGGRLVSFLALLGLAVLSWRIVMLYTADRYSAWIAALCCASSALLLSWGTVGQVDTLAVFWAIGAFYQYSRYALRGDKTLVWAAVFTVLAFFTKQTMIAAPAAIFLLLWPRSRRAALEYGASVAGASLLLCLVINSVLGGRFFADTVLANINPFSMDKLWQHLRFALSAAGPLFLVAAIGAKAVFRTQSRAVFVYLAAALAVFAGTSPKMGSDLNYQIEFTVVLILCAAVTLHALDFFPLAFSGSKTWITLLQVPIALFLVVNIRVAIQDMIVRAAMDQAAQKQIEAERPYLGDGQRVISADYNAMARLQHRLTVEMLIYKLLSDAGVTNPEPVRRDLAAGAFSSVVLFGDLDQNERGLDPEISTLPAAQLQEIRRHYRLVAHTGSLYIYQPVPPR